MTTCQTTSHRKGNAPSATIMIRQFQWSKIQPENGADTITARGKQTIHNAFARARSLRGNQCERSTSVMGQTAPSATPKRNRITQNSCHVWISPQPTAQTPQATSRILIKSFALQQFAR